MWAELYVLSTYYIAVITAIPTTGILVPYLKYAVYWESLWLEVILNFTDRKPVVTITVDHYN